LAARNLSVRPKMIFQGKFLMFRVVRHIVRAKINSRSHPIKKVKRSILTVPSKKKGTTYVVSFFLEFWLPEAASTL